MTVTALARRERGFGARLWGSLVAFFGAVTGVAPHILHHAGPLAGAALFAGFSSVVVAPRLTDSDEPPATPIEQPQDHRHHPERAK